MATMIKKHLARYIKFQRLILLLIFAITANTFAQDPYQRVVRKIDPSEFGIPNVSGLGFSPSAEAFLVVTAPGASEIVMFDKIGELSGSVKMRTAIVDPLNMALNSKSNSLLFLDSDANELIEIDMGANAGLTPSSETIARMDSSLETTFGSS